MFKKICCRDRERDPGNWGQSYADMWGCTIQLRHQELTTCPIRRLERSLPTPITGKVYVAWEAGAKRKSRIEILGIDHDRSPATIPIWGFKQQNQKRYFSALMRRSWDVVTNRWPTRWFLAAKIRTPGSMKKRCLEPTDGFQSTLHMFDPKISPVNGEPIIDDAPVGYGWFARQTGLLTGQMSNLSQEICKFGGHHLPFGKVSNVSTIHKLVWISYQMTIIQFRQDHNIIYIYILVW